MKFQKKKITEDVRGILGKYLDGTEKEFREATDKIVNLIKSEHIAKEHFRKQRDNALIASDKSDVWVS
jgi:CRISPR/Cas system-associated endonuclease Cas1